MLALTLAPVVAVNPVPGAHVYVAPPVAVSVAALPLQIATPAPALIAGNGFMDIVVDAVPLHPLASVPVTVYDLFAVGVAITLLPVVADRLELGLHV